MKIRSSSECPSTTPFFNGEICVACALPKFWNYDDLKCESCPADQHYDINRKACLTCDEGFEYDQASYQCVK